MVRSDTGKGILWAARGGTHKRLATHLEEVAVSDRKFWKRGKILIQNLFSISIRKDAQQHKSLGKCKLNHNELTLHII